MDDEQPATCNVEGNEVVHKDERELESKANASAMEDGVDDDTKDSWRASATEGETLVDVVDPARTPANQNSDAENLLELPTRVHGDVAERALHVRFEERVVSRVFPSTAVEAKNGAKLPYRVVSNASVLRVDPVVESRSRLVDHDSRLATWRSNNGRAREEHAWEESVERVREVPTLKLLGSRVGEKLKVLLGMLDGAVPRRGEVARVTRPESFADATQDGLDQGTVWMREEEGFEPVQVEGGGDVEEVGASQERRG